jgi:uncharacterized surface protein with fasciclin (FAS1) repeats
LVYTYMENRPEKFSEFIKVVDKAGLKGMLSAYGQYTCLSPTNEAMHKFYQSQGNNFTIDSLKQKNIEYLAKTHIVENKHFIYELQDGILPNTNMNDRSIEIYFTIDSIHKTEKILLNDSSQIISKNNEVYNGIVHAIDRVIEPDIRLLPELMLENTDISIFTEALLLTGMDDSLRLVRDDTYKPSNSKINHTLINYLDPRYPLRRKYGYTALVECNELLKAHGINTLDDLKNKANELYPSGKGYENDYKNRKNSLNQYISYHLVEKAIYLNTFFYRSNAIQGYTPDEFIETMLPNRIIRASRKYNRIVFNPDTEHSVLLQETGSQTSINGVYHLLENMLVYNNNVESMLKNTRIRFDIASILPEMENNGLRAEKWINNSYLRVFDPDYFKYLNISRDTEFAYFLEHEIRCNFQGDEFAVYGFYDINLRLLPVPPGTYELRFGYFAGPFSLAQTYVDNVPIGIPVNLGLSGNWPEVGWLLDSETEDNGIKNDEILHNKGYMKAPNTFYALSLHGTPLNARDNSMVLRKVVGTFSFPNHQPHYLRFRSATTSPENSLNIDYIELVPKSIYNPQGEGNYESRD